MLLRQLLFTMCVLLLTATSGMAAGTKKTQTQKSSALDPIPQPTITSSQQGPATTPQSAKPSVVKPPPSVPPAVLSIIPAQAEPGINVILSGSGFTETTNAWLGTLEVHTRLLGPEQLSFELPQLAPGLYALFLKNSTGLTSKTYSFTVLPRKPVVTSLTPDVITACSQDREREVTVHGRNFNEDSSVLFDGAAVRSRFVPQDGIAFQTPQVAGGQHNIQVKNADETTSGSIALMIDSRPEISNVTTGTEEVNYYELHLRGKNFQQGSAVIVDGRRIGSTIANPGERDRVIYLDCNHIIYLRYPYDPSTKELRIQVVNSSGEQSSAISVSAP